MVTVVHLEVSRGSEVRFNDLFLIHSALWDEIWVLGLGIVRLQNGLKCQMTCVPFTMRELSLFLTDAQLPRCFCQERHGVLCVAVLLQASF